MTIAPHTPIRDRRPAETGHAVARHRLSVIYNPVAGGGRKRRLLKVIDRLERAGCVVTLKPTTGPGEAERLGAAFDPAEADALVAAGGDGTINEVVNGLMALPAGARPALGIIPMGTANVLAHEIGLKLRPDAIAGTLMDGAAKPIHLGRADGGRFFTLMAGAGFDGQVVAGVNLRLKHHAGKLAYVWATLVQALKYDFPTLTVTVDGETRRTASAVICNGRYYGGPFVAAPDADLGTPRLHCVLLHRKGHLAVTAYGLGLLLGTLSKRRDVTLLDGAAITVDGPDGLPVQGDGDLIARLPMTVRVAEETLDLIYP